MHHGSVQTCAWPRIRFSWHVKATEASSVLRRGVQITMCIGALLKSGFPAFSRKPRSRYTSILLNWGTTERQTAIWELWTVCPKQEVTHSISNGQQAVHTCLNLLWTTVHRSLAQDIATWELKDGLSYQPQLCKNTLFAREIDAQWYVVKLSQAVITSLPEWRSKWVLLPSSECYDNCKLETF